MDRGKTWAHQGSSGLVGGQRLVWWAGLLHRELWGSWPPQELGGLNLEPLHKGGRGGDRGGQLRPRQEAGTVGHAQNGEGEMYCPVAMPHRGRADTEALTGKMQVSLGNACSFLLSLSLSFSQRSKEGLRG